MSNFVILIGGPGLFMHCDKAHDQTWLNYIVPLQLAAQRDLYKREASEQVHWVLYEPPYENRWRDDSVITKAEQKQDDGAHLHSIRKAAADKILGTGAKSYIDRIKTVANKNSITYKGIKKPHEFWTYLSSLTDGSITRIWYSGHASGNALMLSLTHNASCEAAAFPKDMINITDISKNRHLSKKFSKSTKKVSKFYGCFTSGFAKTWNKEFSVSAAGAEQKIDFGVVNRASSIVNVMERIEKTPTSVGAPDWKEYK